MGAFPRRMLPYALVLSLLVSPGLPGLRAEEAAIGSVKAMSGQVLLRSDAAGPFSPAAVGSPLHGGGTVLVLEESSATLAITGRKDLTLDDNAALNLRDVDGTGEFAAVTGVRAPVLFLFPKGNSSPQAPGPMKLAFGVHHGLDAIRDVTRFRVYALHEEAQDELPLDAPSEALVEAATVVAEFLRKKDAPRDGYTWYALTTRLPFEKGGEYELFVAAVEGETVRRLGESSLVDVTGEDLE